MAHIRTVTVSSKGQIVIPEEIRKELAIKEGSKLVLIEKEGKMMLEKEEDTFKDVYKFSAKALAEIWARPEEDIWHEYLKNER
ncbi:MAG TPA: AbrB/MazE/SpoVT family DNA-binding domain-containing protein [Candidatus Nanoarchaeia archaeon]|nr:AbrB/MazE/SpoVT family DNA-binding domain-containing protein [Candidatus Nanoarchaeia archaeon]